MSVLRYFNPKTDYMGGKLGGIRIKAIHVCFPRIIPIGLKIEQNTKKVILEAFRVTTGEKSPKYLKNAPRAQVDIILDNHLGIPLARIPQHVGGYIATAKNWITEYIFLTPYTRYGRSLSRANYPVDNL